VSAESSDVAERPLLDLVTSPARVERYANIQVEIGSAVAPNAWPAAGLLNHLWQSTTYTLIVVLLAILFRKYAAGIRYWLWFSASVKFLVPFSVLVLVGTWMPLTSTASNPSTPDWSLTLAQLSQPFAEKQPRTVLPTTDRANDFGPWVVLLLLSIWACGFIGVLRLRAAMDARSGCRSP
jgi:beta-lactamase regulating signal transducer with metallopeptidase domain